jgi:hypothetical protein
MGNLSLSQPVASLFVDLVTTPRLERVLADVLHSPAGQLHRLKPLLTNDADLAIDGVGELFVGWLAFQDVSAGEGMCLFVGYDAHGLETWCAVHNRAYTLSRVEAP